MEKLDPRAVGLEEATILEALKTKVFGQDRALEAISSAFGFYNSFLRNPDKPIGVFILAGPPGVGKMKIVQALAEYLFTDPMGFCYVNCDKPVPLEQINLDRAHQRFLEALHKEEVDKMYERGGGLMEEYEKLKSLAANIAEMKKDPNADLAELKRLVEELKKRNLNHAKANLKLAKDLKEAAIKGWRYDEEHPPQDLLSVAFFDHATEAEPPFHAFLEEALDNGQIAYMKDGKLAYVSIKNSFVFISLTIPFDKIEEILAQEGKLGFHGSHPQQMMRQGAEKQTHDFIMEEVRRFIPARIVDRVRVIGLNILDQADLMKILESKIQDLLINLVQRGVPLLVSVEQSLKDYLVKEAFNHRESGAWYLERIMGDTFAVALDRLLKTGQLNKSDNVRVSLVNQDGKDEIVFEKEDN